MAAAPSEMGADMTEHERAEAIYDLQEIARQHERLEKAWVDVVIAAMELEFIGGAQ